MTTNKAAEPLRFFLKDHNINTVYIEYLDEALATAYKQGLSDGRLVQFGPEADRIERRATVGRIRERARGRMRGHAAVLLSNWLDEEAAR